MRPLPEMNRNQPMGDNPTHPRILEADGISWCVFVSRNSIRSVRKAPQIRLSERQKIVNVNDTDACHPIASENL